MGKILGQRQGAEPAGRRRTLIAAICTVAAMLAALAGCGRGAYLYTGSEHDHMFFKVPSGWSRLSMSANASTTAGQVLWVGAFDASAEPSIDHILAVTSQPVVYATVVQMTIALRSRLSFNAMRDLILPVTQQARTTAAQTDPALTGFVSLTDQVITTSDGVRGIGEQYAYTLNGVPEIFALKVLTNSQTTKLYVLLVQCDEMCYIAHRSQIGAVVQSFTVKGS
jgi:hypothetical protein